MTVYDLLALLRRNLKLIIALPVICVIIAIALSLFAQSGYTATATFVTSGDLAFSQGLASNQAASYSNSSVRVTCTSSSSSKQVSVTATGSNPDECVEAANAVANAAVRQYKEANNSVIATVSEANYAASNGSSIVKDTLMALVIGLFAAVCIIVFLDYLKAPIKSREDAEQTSGLPVLSEIPHFGSGERLLANLQFRNDGKPSTIAVVPIGFAAIAPVVAKELAGALEHSDIRVKLVKGSPHARKFQVSVPDNAAVIVSCEPLDEGMGAAYVAHNADATIICVNEWVDSKKQLISTVRELELAKANTVGLVVVSEGKIPEKPRDEKRA